MSSTRWCLSWYCPEMVSISVTSTVNYAEKKKGDNLMQMLGINTYVYMWLVDYCRLQ